MEKVETDISGLLVLQPKIFSDERGFFAETYHAGRYAEKGVDDVFVQDNLSRSKKGVLRGLHYQLPPFAQGKLVSVVYGKVMDVAVDIRPQSPTFGKHVAVELSADNKKQFWIPPGFAHGFVALEDDTVFIYKCTNVYSPDHDRGILWNDPDIGIAWPMENPIVSEKDRKHPFLKDVEKEILKLFSV